MDLKNEKRITEKLFKFLMNGGLYKSVKPVYWSVVEQTALAEAEVEYKDKTSPSIFVGFKIHSAQDPDFIGAHALIWTTTPWTLPANRAIAYNPDVTYVLAEIKESNAAFQKIIVAQDLLSSIEKETGHTLTVLKSFSGTALSNTLAQHPWRGQGYEFDVPLLPGDHVTLDQGTGLVHTAPGHGQEDFVLGKKFNLEIAQPVGDDGFYYKHVPLWAGEHVYKVNDKIIASLKEANSLLFHSEITHSYPHSWRSKAPLIFRTTPQWFISMETNELREKALKTINTDVQWIPPQGRNRLHAMVSGRPDWCLSRQRVWGIPLPIFVHKETQEILKDPDLNEKILARIEEEGTDFWFNEKTTEELLAPKYNPSDYQKSTDILDVWFESGCSYSFLKETDVSHLPIDLYLEGSDQHRGWFQSTLLVALGADNKTPYKTVLTHGFIVDEHGYKLSKSKGNAVNLDDVLKQDGADILRLWVAGSDYQDDLRLGKQIIKFQQENYRKLRNVLRFMLGNLPEDQEIESIPYNQLPLLEKFTLHHLAHVIETCEKHLMAYNLHGLYRELFSFCVTLSSFYFDIRKDTLYCEGEKSLTYKSCLFVLNTLFETLTKWLAPILSFTAEEAWQKRFPGESIFLQPLNSVPSEWKNPELNAPLETCRLLKSQVNGTLEKARAEKLIGSSLEASLKIYMPEEETLKTLFTAEEWADFFIVSSVSFVETPEADFETIEGSNLKLKVEKHTGKKCARCWKYVETLHATEEENDSVCTRCHEVLHA